MAHLFEKSEFNFISLPRLAENYTDNHGERIELPGFQRGAVWKAKNVEELWDSILRWFPIGSLLLARSTEFSEVMSREPQLSKSADLPEISEGANDVLLLVDGQQRSNAIALGFIPWDHAKAREAAARLWLDLAEPADRNNKPYEFYLCTADDPFGEGLSAAQKRDALAKIGQLGKDDSELALNVSYPFKAKLPVPLAEFLQAIKENDDWNQLKEYLIDGDRLGLEQTTRELVSKNLRNTTPRSDIPELIQKIRSVVYDEEYKIPVILFKNRNNRVDSTQLGKLFERININGVTPPQAELFFSALKLRMPELGNYVAQIDRSDELEGLFRPTEIVLAALRLIKPEITGLELSLFNRLTNSDTQGLRKLMEHGDGQESEFQRCMRLAYHALHYRGGEDFGLPRQLIARLRPRVWHTLLIWIHSNLNQIGKEISSSDRLDMVRFAALDSMHYQIFVPYYKNEWQGYTQFINKDTLDRIFPTVLLDNTTFSVRKIYQRLQEYIDATWETKTTIQIMKPEEYKAWLTPDEKPNWRSYNDGDVLLLYGQRQYLSKWEKLNDMDKDHIIPYSWMVFKGNLGSEYFWKNSIDVDLRYAVMGSPGNFRYWPAALNRGYQDKPPREKFILRDRTKGMDENHAGRSLEKSDNILHASFVDDEPVALLEEIQDLRENNDDRIWTEERFNLFKTFTNERSYKMYRNLYETLRLEELAG